MSVGAVNKSTGDRIPTAGMPAIDAALSGSSTNPVQNMVVKAALDEKADTDIVASDFSTAVSYIAGNYCIYDGKFYKFKNNHSGAWSAADVDEIKIAGELSSLMSGLIDVNSNLTELKIPQQGRYWGAYPNGRTGSTARVTIPAWNPNGLTAVVNEAYIYNSNGDYTNIINDVSVYNQSKVFVNVNITFNAEHAGKLLRVDLRWETT